jgi:uncharacterized membrane protein YphA (DoxX/SURF4 family)
VAIGWHFLYEGLEKIDSTRRGGKPFTAEPYLRASTGPLAPYFRNLVPDVNSLEILDRDKLKAACTADVDRIGGHFGFTKEQFDKARTELRHTEEFIDIWFTDKEMTEQREKYFAELRHVVAIEKDPQAMSFQRERAAAKRKDLDNERQKLIVELLVRVERLKGDVIHLATDEQLQAAGPYVPPRTTLDTINDLTMYGLVAMGLCLILGLFGPLPALAGAVFLGQIYLSMPPWPGLPASPMAEGHYLIVNKNLIEMLACLALVFIPTNTWIGFDPLVFGWMFRRRQTRDDDRPTAPDPVRGSGTGTGRSRPEDDKPIPLSSPGFPERT